MANEKPERLRVADQIFSRLCERILRGELAIATSLPSEQALAAQFGVARGTIREAIHKLADARLVQTRQGGATTVLDHRQSFDVRVTQVRYQLGPQDERDRRMMIERRMLQGFSLVFLAQKRATKEQIMPLYKIACDFAERGAPESELADVERQVWVGLAKIGGNELFERETAWWAGIQGQRDVGSSMPAAMRAQFYREVFRRLVEADGAARYYLDVLELVI